MSKYTYKLSLPHPWIRSPSNIQKKMLYLWKFQEKNGIDFTFFVFPLVSLVYSWNFNSATGLKFASYVFLFGWIFQFLIHFFPKYFDFFFEHRFRFSDRFSSSWNSLFIWRWVFLVFKWSLCSLKFWSLLTLCETMKTVWYTILLGFISKFHFLFYIKKQKQWFIHCIQKFIYDRLQIISKFNNIYSRGLYFTLKYKFLHLSIWISFFEENEWFEREK